MSGAAASIRPKEPRYSLLSTLPLRAPRLRRARRANDPREDLDREIHVLSGGQRSHRSPVQPVVDRADVGDLQPAVLLDVPAAVLDVIVHRAGYRAAVRLRESMPVIRKQ